MFRRTLVFLAVAGEAGGQLFVHPGDFLLRGRESLDRVPGARPDFPGPLDCFAGVRQGGHQAPFGLRGFPLDLGFLSLTTTCRPLEPGFLPVQALSAAGQQGTGPLDARQHALLQVIDCDAIPSRSLIELAFALIELALALVQLSLALVGRTLSHVRRVLPRVGRAVAHVGRLLPRVGRPLALISQAGPVLLALALVDRALPVGLGFRRGGCGLLCWLWESSHVPSMHHRAQDFRRRPVRTCTEVATREAGPCGHDFV